MDAESSNGLGRLVGAFGHASDTGRAAAPPIDAPDEMAARKARHIALGIFRSPEDAPPKCEPNGGDRTMLSYRCPRPECAALPMGWGTYAEPRAWGIDRDLMPEDTWCPLCGTEGELRCVEAPEVMLRRLAPELGT
jgi:hypothetical protein